MNKLDQLCSNLRVTAGEACLRLAMPHIPEYQDELDLLKKQMFMDGFKAAREMIIKSINEFTASEYIESYPFNDLHKIGEEEVE